MPGRTVLASRERKRPEDPQDSCRLPSRLALVSVLVGTTILYADWVSPPERRGDVEARLEVHVTQTVAVQGFAEVRYTLHLTGPATLQVEAARLDDATAAWKVNRNASSWDTEGDRTTWSQTIWLRQVKPGITPLPDVTLRFRGAPDAAWEVVKWLDILKPVRELPPPELPPPPLSGWRGWWPLFVAALAVLLLAGCWAVLRRWAPRAVSVPHQQWALRELDRIEQTLFLPNGGAEGFYVQLAQVLRRYVSERFGVQTLQLTSAEFLTASRQIPGLASEQHALLADLFARCDLVKFARASTSVDEARQAAEVARAFVRQTAANSPSDPVHGSL
jgi:hypothetical protein